jgi:flagellar motor switch protein FliM
MLRLLERSRPRIVDLPAVRKHFEDFAERCSVALREMSSLEATVELELLEQGPFASALSQDTGAVSVTGFIPEWNDRALIRLDPLLFFRVLDAMYGGDVGRRIAVPDRPLTGLERSLASSVATSIMGQLQATLGELSVFSFRSERYAQDLDHDTMGKGKDGYVIVRLRVVEFDDCITLALPAVGLELVRDKLLVGEKEKAPDLDPGWTQEFKRNVASTKIVLVAAADGPSIVLSDVARLQPGSLLEFDGESLRNVRLESEDKPVFIGRLGQSRGWFTICLEALVSPDAVGEDRG